MENKNQSSVFQKSADNAAKTALEVIENCIKNGEQILKACEDSKADGLEKPLKLRKVIERIEEDTKAIVNLQKKIELLQESAKKGDRDRIKKYFDEMMTSVGNISTEKLELLTELMCLTETSNVRKKFRETEGELRKIDGSSDRKTKEFAEILVTRNRKIVECLDYVYKLLPKLLVVKDGVESKSTEVSESMNRSNIQFKLYITSENFPVLSPENFDFDLLANLEVDGSYEDSPQLETSHNTHPRHLLRGFIEDDDGHFEEIVLKLIEPRANSANFSDSGVQNLSATIQFKGTKILHEVSMVEIDLQPEQKTQQDLQESSKMIALVHNDQTGMNQSIEVSMVPTTPEKQIHGRIIELQPAPVQKVNPGSRNTYQKKLNFSYQSEDSADERVEPNFPNDTGKFSFGRQNKSQSLGQSSRSPNQKGRASAPVYKNFMHTKISSGQRESPYLQSLQPPSKNLNATFGRSFDPSVNPLDISDSENSDANDSRFLNRRQQSPQQHKSVYQSSVEKEQQQANQTVVEFAKNVASDVVKSIDDEVVKPHTLHFKSQTPQNSQQNTQSPRRVLPHYRQKIAATTTPKKAEKPPTPIRSNTQTQRQPIVIRNNKRTKLVDRLRQNGTTATKKKSSRLLTKLVLAGKKEKDDDIDRINTVLDNINHDIFKKYNVSKLLQRTMVLNQQNNRYPRIEFRTQVKNIVNEGAEEKNQKSFSQIIDDLKQKQKIGAQQPTEIKSSRSLLTEVPTESSSTSRLSQEDFELNWNESIADESTDDKSTEDESTDDEIQIPPKDDVEEDLNSSYIGDSKLDFIDLDLTE